MANESLSPTDPRVFATMPFTVMKHVANNVPKDGRSYAMLFTHGENGELFLSLAPIDPDTLQNVIVANSVRIDHISNNLDDAGSEWTHDKE